MKAFEQVALFDKRGARSQILAHEIFAEFEDLIPYESQSEAYHRLFDLFVKNGASITTDEEREAYGLEPRDGEGWTPSEMIAERRRREACSKMEPTTK